MADYSPAAVTARLDLLNRLYEPELREETPPAPDRDMSPAGVDRRLDALRELFRLTQWAEATTPRSR